MHTAPLMIILFLSSVTTITTFSQKAYACEVTSLPSIEQAVSDSSAIFSGTVREFRTISVSSGMQDMRAALFEVDTYWKVPADEDFKELVVFTAIDHGACGFDFEEEKSYLVYAWSRDNDSLYTSIGTRTMPIESAQDDLAKLGQGVVPTEQGKWEEQLEMIPLQKEPDKMLDAPNNIMLLVGSGAAIAGLVAFFSLRRLKGNR